MTSVNTEETKTTSCQNLEHQQKNMMASTKASFFKYFLTK